jgi:hypothetical protein
MPWRRRQRLRRRQRGGGQRHHRHQPGAVEASASITDSDVTTGGDLTLDARNLSQIDASTLASTTSGDTAVGVTLAFNVIGWETQNILFNAIDTLIGRPTGDYDFTDSETDADLAQGDRVNSAGTIYWFKGVTPEEGVDLTGEDFSDTARWGVVQSPFAGEQPALVQAYIDNSDLSVAGDLVLSALSDARIDATASNEATAAAVALKGASALSVGVLLAKNSVSSDARAWLSDLPALETGETEHVGGDVTVLAQDASSILADTKVASLASAVNDFGISVGLKFLETMLTDYQFTSASGSQPLSKGALVRVADDYADADAQGKVYRYINETPATLDLGTQSYSTDDTNWKESVVDDLFDFLNDTLGLSSLNISGDAANAFGGLIVRNDVRGGAQASVEDSELTAGGALTVAALESATIEATNVSTVQSAGGTKQGKSIAVNGLIAHNLVLSEALAQINDSDVTTLAGGVTVEAENTSTITASTTSDTKSKGVSVGVTLAFNTIGIESQNLFFDTVDALFGAQIADLEPALTDAGIRNSDVEAAGAVRVSATSEATIEAEISNSSTSMAILATSPTTQVAIGAVIALNKLATEVRRASTAPVRSMRPGTSMSWPRTLRRSTRRSRCGAGARHRQAIPPACPWA